MQTRFSHYKVALHDTLRRFPSTTRETHRFDPQPTLHEYGIYSVRFTFCASLRRRPRRRRLILELASASTAG